MLVSLKLLSYFVDLPKSKNSFCALSSWLRFVNYKDIADILTRQGIEVETIKVIGEGFSSLVIGRVEKVEKHPSADKLSLCKVSLGDKELQIVCGAKNVCEQMWVAVATQGTRINENIIIKESKIRGVLSQGMLCARQEIGLKESDSDCDGIWDLGSDNPIETLKKNIGQSLFASLDMEDILCDLSVTPNRPDCLCHYGIAREIFVGLKFLGLKTSLGLEKFDLKSNLENLFKDVCSKDEVSFRGNNFYIDNTLGCSSFCIFMHDVKVEKSPFWMRTILESLDVQPINNIVDILNYILLCFGQPSHAFDWDKIETQDNTLFSLRFARENETFSGLDGKDIVLSPKDCVVSDSKSPLALLGVMGGESSKVDFDTKNIILEFVNPEPVLVRKSSRRHGKQTSSGFAFEKGIDPVFRWFAASLSISLIKKMAHGHYLSSCHGKNKSTKLQGKDLKKTELSSVTPIDISLLDYYELKTPYQEGFLQGDKETHKISFNLISQRKILGDNYVTFDECYDILDSLGFSPNPTKDNVLELRCPHHRLFDIEGEADIVEEVIRVKGIDSVEAMPMHLKNTVGKDDKHFSFFEKVSSLCANLGYREVISFHFMKDNDFKKLRLESHNTLGAPVKVLNPIIKDESFLQLTLFPDLLRKIEKNINYGRRGGQLFHISRTFQNLDSHAQPVFHEAKGISSKETESLFEYHSNFSLIYSKEIGTLKRPSETPRLASIIFGVREEKSWLNQKDSLWSLYDLMSHVKTLFESLGLQARFEALKDNHPLKRTFHPKKALSISCFDGDKMFYVGALGEFHPDVLRNYDISLSSYGFEVNLALVLRVSQSLPKREHQYESIQSLPIVEKDFAFILKDDIFASQVTEGIKDALLRDFASQSIKAKIRDVFIFDVFQGEGIPQGFKSFALKVRIEPLEKTFTEDSIKRFATTLVTFMERTFAAVLRES